MTAREYPAVAAPKEQAVASSRVKRGTAIVPGPVQQVAADGGTGADASNTSNDKEEREAERERRERQMKLDEEIEQDRRRAAAFAGYQDDEWKNCRPYTRRWTREVSTTFVHNSRTGASVPSRSTALDRSFAQ